jgi:hypothetical protein
MKSSDFHDRTVAQKTPLENDRRYVEVMVSFNEDRKPINQLDNLSEAQGNQKEEMNGLILN